MDPSGNFHAPAGNIVSSKEIESQIERIFKFKDKFEQAQKEAAADDAAAIDEQNEESGPPTKKFKVSQSPSPFMAFAPQPSPAINLVAEKPSQNLTGVEPYVTSICATISQQIYEATSINSFDLIDKNDTRSVAPKVIIFEKHDTLDDLVPPFAVAVSGDIMILAWRGSSSIMDWVSDFSASPVTSSRWSPIAPYVKAHSGYASLVESDLAVYENRLIQEIKDKNIKQLVTTGHSLAGGMAQVSHVFLEGQLQQKGSKWSQLLRRLTVRSIAFAAPMTIMSTMNFAKPDEPTTSFLKKISEHSCNIVYGPDVVPHAYGHTKYINDVIEAVIPEKADIVPFGSWALRWFGIPSKILNKVKNKDGVEKLVTVMMNYNHLGKIIYYAENSSNPVELRDDQFQSANLFRDYAIKVPTKSKTAGSVEDQLTKAHLYFPEALAYNVLKPKPGTNSK